MLTRRQKRLSFHKAVAGMAVVVDAVLLLQLLNVSELSGGVGAGHTITERLVRVQKYFFQTAIQAHVLVLSQIMEQGCETLLQANRDLDALNLHGRACIKYGMSKSQPIPMQGPH